jgi:DNA-binding NarL/FixJ family response regulator
MLKILLADDHNLLRDGLRPFLCRLAPETEVREDVSLPAALAQFETDEAPDLAILDLNMPGMDGVRGIARVKAQFPAARIVVLSGLFDEKTVAGVIEAGAHGFVPKTYPGMMLIAALRRVLAGETYVPEELQSKADAALARRHGAPPAAVPAPETPEHAALSKLTPKECAILRLVIEGKTNKATAIELNLSEVTVKGHLRNAYKKLGAANRADAVRIALQGNFL